MKKRASGLLMHISSLPSRFGIGDLGPHAYEFADFLVKAGQTYWQILPINPTNGFCAHSPYSSNSAFAGNINFISPELLVKGGLLKDSDFKELPEFSEKSIDFENVLPWKIGMLELAYDRFCSLGCSRNDFEWFCGEHAFWLDDFVLYTVLKKVFKESGWNDWDKKFSHRDKDALALFCAEYAEEMEKQKFFQFLFYRQWFALKSYCNERGIELIGDIPIYVSYDSVDVWTLPDHFKLNEDLRPDFIAGVPPDYFSETGQLWGNPIYEWSVHQANGFDWWQKRIAHNLHLFDKVRIDHFRGLVAYWEVPAGETTAVNGYWVDVPVDDLLGSVRERFPHFPIIAEDLGVITDDVRECLARYDIPGMKILQFAFGSNERMHPYLPHTYDKNCVVYTGTHDNNTVCGWFSEEAGKDLRKHLDAYFGKKISKANVHWEMIRMAMSSTADIALIPVQDILGLGSECRMNTPSTVDKNWKWRLGTNLLNKDAARKMFVMTELYGRA